MAKPTRTTSTDRGFIEEQCINRKWEPVEHVTYVCAEDVTGKFWSMDLDRSSTERGRHVTRATSTHWTELGFEFELPRPEKYAVGHSITVTITGLHPRR